MSSFNAAGRVWTLEVNLDTRRAVRDATGGKVDLFAAFGEELYVLLADPEHLVDTLWAMVKDQAGTITAGEFGRAFRGDLIERASEALQEAIADFFPTRQKALLTKAVTKGNEQMAMILEQIHKDLDRPARLPTSNENSTTSPGSPASTPVA